MGSWRLLTRGRRKMRRKRRERAIPFAPVAPRGVNIRILFEGALIAGSTGGPGKRSDISSHVGVERALCRGCGKSVPEAVERERRNVFVPFVAYRKAACRSGCLCGWKRCGIFLSWEIVPDGIPMTRSADSCVRSEVSERLVNRYTTTESMLHS